MEPSEAVAPPIETPKAGTPSGRRNSRARRPWGKVESDCSEVSRLSSVKLTTVAFCFLLAGGLGGLIVSLVLDHRLGREFLTSAGFGGLMAVAAAVVALMAARHTAATAKDQAEQDRKQRYAAQRKEQWWARAEWAMNQVAAGNNDIGYLVLEALAESEWAEVHESDVVAAATMKALEAELWTPSSSNPEEWLRELRSAKMGEGGSQDERALPTDTRA